MVGTISMLTAALALLSVSTQATPSAQTLEKIQNIHPFFFGPAVTPQQRRLIVKGVTQTMEFDLQTPKDSWYARTWGGQDIWSALSYLRGRVNYIIPGEEIAKPKEKGHKAGSSPKLFTIATNFGLSSWMHALSHLTLQHRQPWFTGYAIGDVPMPLMARSGMITLEKLAKEADPEKTPNSWVMGMLMHEGRHSDCSQPLPDRNGAFPKDCGHPHIRCPSWHAFYDPEYPTYACDDQPWGAYMIEAIFFTALAQNCQNCSAGAKQYFVLNAIDRYYRNSGVSVKDMLDGRLGMPDTRSQEHLQDYPRVMWELSQFQKARAQAAHRVDRRVKLALPPGN